MYPLGGPGSSKHAHAVYQACSCMLVLMRTPSFCMGAADCESATAKKRGLPTFGQNGLVLRIHGRCSLSCTHQCSAAICMHDDDDDDGLCICMLILTPIWVRMHY